jgi:hypothetical protein
MPAMLSKSQTVYLLTSGYLKTPSQCSNPCVIQLIQSYWLIGIPLMDDCNPQCIGYIITNQQHQWLIWSTDSTRIPPAKVSGAFSFS